MFPAACLTTWLFGIFLSGYLGSNILVFILPPFLAGLWMVGALIVSRIRKEKVAFYKTVIKPLILLVLFVLSSLLYQGYEQLHYNKAVSLCEENPASLTGVITGEVHRYNNTDYCTLTMENAEKVSVKVRTDTPLFPGEKVTLYEPILSAVQPRNRESVQVRKLMGNDTFLSASFPYEATVTRHGVENWWLYGSKSLRNEVRAHFSQHYPPRIASFLTALLSSDKSMMEQDLYQEFLDTGTVHIVVVSGMHFSYLATALLLGLGFLIQSRRKRLLVTLPLLLVFGWFTGGTIPVIRSLLMTMVLFYYDIFYQKPLKSYVTVLGIACLFVTVTPTLIFHPSFLLTFGATFGITAFYEPLQMAFRKIPTRYLRNSLAMYVAVQPFTFPVILLYFSRIPLGAILANFLVAPLVAPILIVAIIGIAVAQIPLIGTWILGLGTLLSELFLWLIHACAGISRPVTVSLTKLPFLLWMGGGILLFFTCRITTKKTRIAAAILSAVCLMTAFTNTVFPIPNQQLTITFFGAKNTNSAAIRTPADRLILYGSLQDIAYGRGSAYDEHAPVALIILTDLSDSERTEELLNELPSAQIIFPAQYEYLLKNKAKTVPADENLTAGIDGINLRLFADHNTIFEAEFSYRNHQFSFTGDAGYFLRNSHQNPSKLWIVNFKRSSSATERIGAVNTDVQILSKKQWHPDATIYDNYSMLIFRRNDVTFYGTKEPVLWN